MIGMLKPEEPEAVEPAAAAARQQASTARRSTHAMIGMLKPEEPEAVEPELTWEPEESSEVNESKEAEESPLKEAEAKEAEEAPLEPEEESHGVGAAEVVTATVAGSVTTASFALGPPRFGAASGFLDPSTLPA